MSCTFWLRRKKKVADELEKSRLEAEKRAERERQAAEAARKAAEKKAAQKAVAKDDKEGTV